MSEENRRLVGLARRALAGDRAAEAAVIDWLYRHVRRELQKMRDRPRVGFAGDSDRAQEIVTEAWTDLREFWGERDPQLAAYVNKLLRHYLDDEVQELYAAKRDIRRRAKLEAAAEVVERRPSPEQSAEQAELAAAVKLQARRWFSLTRGGGGAD